MRRGAQPAVNLRATRLHHIAGAAQDAEAKLIHGIYDLDLFAAAGDDRQYLRSQGGGPNVALKHGPHPLRKRRPHRTARDGILVSKKSSAPVTMTSAGIGTPNSLSRDCIRSGRS